MLTLFIVLHCSVLIELFIRSFILIVIRTFRNTFSMKKNLLEINVVSMKMLISCMLEKWSVSVTVVSMRSLIHIMFNFVRTMNQKVQRNHCCRIIHSPSLH